MSTIPSMPAWADLYLSCLTLDEDGDIVAINTEQWRALEEVRVTLDAPFPVGVPRLMRPGTLVSAWLHKGLWLLRGDGPTRLYACDCAERTLPIYEARYPGDMRPRRAIEVARAYARGEATADELRAAARAAARAASASSAAVHSATAHSAHYAATATYHSASNAVANAAFVAAARAAFASAYAASASDAERRWQVERMAQYVMGAESAGPACTETARVR